MSKNVLNQNYIGQGNFNIFKSKKNFKYKINVFLECLNSRKSFLNLFLILILILGYYGTFMPNPILRHVIENPEWYTSYTPY